jgi:Flp pilus assembly protein TadB
MTADFYGTSIPVGWIGLALLALAITFVVIQGRRRKQQRFAREFAARMRDVSSTEAARNQERL